MNNFESVGTPTPSAKNVEQKVSGLEGMCEKCGGKGKTRVGVFDMKLCGNCHGKGFVRTEPPTVDNSYSWDTGVRH